MENLEKIENEVAELKSEVHSMKERNNMLEKKIRNINEQLSNTFSIVFKRLIDLERQNLNEKENALNDISSATENVTPEPVVPLEEIKTKKKIVKKTSTKHHTYKCNQCNFKGNNQITVNKHMNKKHDQVKTHQDGKKYVLDFECSSCEEKFSNIKDLEEHISENL